MKNIKLTSHHGGPLHYLGNRYLTLPDSSGHMKTDNNWLADIFAIITVNGSKTYQKCVEPFAGSASFSLAAMEVGLAEEYIINDSDSILVNTHRLIQDKPDLIKETYTSLVNAYQRAVSKEEFFIAIIRKYNQIDEKEKSLLLPFIINHSWGGMIFHNANHDIIYRKHSINKQIIPGYLQDANLALNQFLQEVDRVSILLNKNQVTFKSGDFIHAIAHVNSSDIVVLNPPYPENERSSDKTHMYTELYSPKKLHENIASAILHFEENDIAYFMTYGFYNCSMHSFVLNEATKTESYFYQLGYPECAFGMALDQIYFSSNVKIPDRLTAKFILRKTLLANRILTEHEALEEFLHSQGQKMELHDEIY